MGDVGHGLLDQRPLVLDQGSGQRRVFAARQHAGHPQRHLPQRAVLRHDAAQGHRLALIVGVGLGQHLQQELGAAEVALGAAALEGQLGRHLGPAAALRADQAIVRHGHIVEGDLVEVMLAELVEDGPHCQPGGLHVHQKLRHAGVAVLAALTCAHQRDHVVGAVGA